MYIYIYILSQQCVGGGEGCVRMFVYLNIVYMCVCEDVCVFEYCIYVCVCVWILYMCVFEDVGVCVRGCWGVWILYRCVCEDLCVFEYCICVYVYEETPVKKISRIYISRYFILYIFKYKEYIMYKSAVLNIKNI